MTKEEYRAAIDDVIYLVSCAVNGTKADISRVAAMNLEQVYAAANRHLLTAITAAALESAGVRDEAFTQAKGKAIRRVAAMDVDKALLLAQLESAGIWYIPLKGAVLKDYYPAYGLREMTDFDILFDADSADDVRRIMEGLGFTTVEFGTSVRDVYFKQPVSKYEMHRALFGPIHGERPSAYYADVKQRLIKDEGNSCGWHFSVEDFYIYITAHEYKHYSYGGTGLRSLLDIYVYLRRFGDAMQWDYVQSEVGKLGLSDFEARNRRLAMNLFSGGQLSADDRGMLDYIALSGAYGTFEHSVANRLKAYGGGKRGKARYLMNRIFLPMESIQRAYPFFYQHKLLLPLLFFYRVGRALSVSWLRVKREIKVLMRRNG